MPAPNIRYDGYLSRIAGQTVPAPPTEASFHVISCLVHASMPGDCAVAAVGCCAGNTVAGQGGIETVVCVKGAGTTAVEWQLSGAAGTDGGVVDYIEIRQ